MTSASKAAKKEKTKFVIDEWDEAAAVEGQTLQVAKAAIQRITALEVEVSRLRMELKEHQRIGGQCPHKL